MQSKLPFRTLWYQIEPILAYKKLHKYERVFEISNKVLNYYNRAYSELYHIKGEIYKEQDSLKKSEEEFAKAKYYNQTTSYLVNLE